jgi:hypothetical protein
MYETFKVKRLCGSFHDEYILRFKDSEPNKQKMKELVTKSIDQVNETYLLRRSLGCDIQFGKRYSDIH